MKERESLRNTTDNKNTTESPTTISSSTTKTRNDTTDSRTTKKIKLTEISRVAKDVDKETNENRTDEIVNEEGGKKKVNNQETGKEKFGPKKFDETHTIKKEKENFRSKSESLKKKSKNILAMLENPMPSSAPSQRSIPKRTTTTRGRVTNKRRTTTTRRQTTRSRKRTTMHSRRTTSPPSNGPLKEFCRTKHTGSYPNLMDCTKYWVCAGGRTYPARCPQGLIFNFKVHGCDTRDSIPSEMVDYFWARCDPHHNDIALLQQKNNIPEMKSRLRMLDRKLHNNSKFVLRPLGRPSIVHRMEKRRGIRERPVPLGNSPLW